MTSISDVTSRPAAVPLVCHSMQTLIKGFLWFTIYILRYNKSYKKLQLPLLLFYIIFIVIFVFSNIHDIHLHSFVMLSLKLFAASLLSKQTGLICESLGLVGNGVHLRLKTEISKNIFFY